MKEEVKNWLDSAQYDLETAEYMLDTGRYIYTIFMCHFLGELSNLSVVTRYPKDFQEILKAFTKERTKDFLEKTKEAFQWIEQFIEP